jgi:hypothetical protein
MSEHLDADVEAELKRIKRERMARERENKKTKANGHGAKQRTATDTGKRPAKDVLIELADAADFFHTADDIAYANILVGDHRESWPVRSRGFKRWIVRQFFRETQSAPNSEALHAALGVIEAQAHYDAPGRMIFTRLAELGGRIYIDLCNASWQAIEISEDGWRVIDNPPVRFRRAAGMLPLPVPRSGGHIGLLRPYLNLPRTPDAEVDHAFVLTVSVMLAYMRPCGPFPVLALAGEQGVAKSTFSGIVRKLIDASSAPLRALPREDRDLFIAARNGWLLAFDNVSNLPVWISDTLCRLSTGGGFSVRQLFTDTDDILFDAMRPVILNGIENMVDRPDLADRTVFLTLEPIPDDKRKLEKKLWADFERDRPLILGALLNMVVHGLQHLPSTKLSRLPRMADFAQWAIACGGAAWNEGTFLAAYEGNRSGAIEDVLDADAVATAVRTMMSERTEWTGTATALLVALNQVVGDGTAKSKGWPRLANKLSGCLRRAAAFLRKVGVEIKFAKGRNRLITIATAPQPDSGGNSSSPSSPSSPVSPANDLGAADDGDDGTGNRPHHHPH